MYEKERIYCDMIDLINDIEGSLKNNHLRVALGMALILPDICGQIEYPNKSVGKRYITWCNKYVFNQGFCTVNVGSNEPYTRVISGDVCYKLRCAYLHSGNTELNQTKDDHFPKFKLLMCNKNDRGIYIEKPYEYDEKVISIDVRHLIRVLCYAATEYYNQFENKDIFSTKHINIFDVEEEAKKAKKYIDIVNKNCSQESLSDNAQNILKSLKTQNLKELLTCVKPAQEPEFYAGLMELIKKSYLKID